MVSLDPLSQNYPQELHGLREWASQQGLVISNVLSRDRWLDGGYVRRPAFLTLTPDNGQVQQAFEFEEDFECVRCGETHLAYTAECAAGLLICENCCYSPSITGHELRVVEGRAMCAGCVQECAMDECSSSVSVGRGVSFCEEHGQNATCARCNSIMEVAIGEEVPWVSRGSYAALCEDCAEDLCPRCESFFGVELTYSLDLDTYVCRRCFIEALYGENAESFDEEAVINARRLRIPTIPGRENVRTCGVEIEGANGQGTGEDLAQALYALDLSSFDEMAGYHHGSGSGFCHVESDSSVDWELVIGPFNPAEQSDVTRLNQAVRLVRDMVHEGDLGLDLRAGLHIHIGAERVSLDGAFHLNTLFAYLEDVIFRLGAARWPIHRAVANTHYTQPIPKELRKLEFARTHGDEGSRYYALSFNNYFRRMLQNCTCGAVRYDSWEDCTCDLGKCTFEFRVFNTTANPRKLHAYLALTQALVSKALSMERVSDPQSDFPAMTFEASRFKDLDDVRQEELRAAWSERLAWMFAELPLTDSEKESLIYCIKHSELDAIGENTINELFPQDVEVAEEVLA